MFPRPRVRPPPPPIHPLSNPQRSKHPIIPPGRRAVSSSALELRSRAAQTAQKHLEGPRRGRAGCGRKPGVSRRSCGPPATTPRALTLKPTAACPAKGWRGHSALRGSTAEAFGEKRPSDQVLENSWRRVETFECPSIRPKNPLKIQAASERLKCVADIEFYMLDSSLNTVPDPFRNFLQV